MDWLVPLLVGILATSIGIALWEVRDWFWQRAWWMPMWMLRQSMWLTPIFFMIAGVVMIGVAVYAAVM